ncbi:MAG: RDD family protein, partial [Acidobacteriaceae bacterium]|nr:RDD family protein [Acidobacteriaceae bacterium]
IRFRLAPDFADRAAMVEIPGNLIEFPRHLVAPRRARPRLAEGPLRENLDAQTGPSQLRIFEAEPLVVADTPEYPASASVEPAAPEWSSILLSPQPAPAVAEPVPGEPVVQEAMLPQTAPIQLRLMAAMVDGVLITAALLVFATTLVVTANYLGRLGVFHLAPAAPKTVLILSGVALVVLGLIYQLLFFTWADATPGMRYARIGLCTFSDDNPTRAQMRRRIWAHLLSACPLGLGYLWAVLDDDRLSWHDRITRMYQRSY